MQIYQSDNEYVEYKHLYVFVKSLDRKRNIICVLPVSEFSTEILDPKNT